MITLTGADSGKKFKFDGTEQVLLFLFNLYDSFSEEQRASIREVSIGRYKIYLPDSYTNLRKQCNYFLK